MELVSNKFYRVEINKQYTVKCLMKKFNIGRTAAYESKKRGHVNVPREKIANIDIDNFNIDEAYSAAGFMWWKHFADRIKSPFLYIDDCKQQAVLEIFELSGVVLDDRPNARFNYYCKISKFAMMNYLHKQKEIGCMEGRIISYDTLTPRQQGIN